MRTVLDRRALNRATLDRQMLLRRSDRSPLAAIEHLVGMQAQAPFPPYFGLWSRLANFHPDQLVRLILDRDVVRVALMRSTVHLVSAADALAIRPLLQPALERMFGSTVFARDLVGVDTGALVETACALMETEPRTGRQLDTLLAAHWPGRATSTLSNAIRTLTPLVQVPPRGLWGRGGQATLTTIEAWLGRPVDAEPDVDRVVLRYLGAFGPASVADVQAWSGLTRLREVTDRLRSGLTVLRGDTGTELFDLPDARRPSADTPAPVRLIAEFDNLTLSYADRTRVLSDETRRRVSSVNGHIPGMVLIDGFVAGIWRLERNRTGAILAVTTFGAVAPADRDAIGAEGLDLLRFAAPEADGPDVQIVET